MSEDREKKYNDHIRALDFADAGYEERLGAEYAKTVAEKISDERGFTRIPTSNAYLKPGGRFLPSHHHLGVEAKGSVVRYNPKFVSDREVIEAIKDGLKRNQVTDDDIAEMLESSE